MMPLLIAFVILAVCVFLVIFAIRNLGREAEQDGLTTNEPDGASFANVVALNSRLQLDKQAAELLRDYQQIQMMPPQDRIEAQAAWRGRVTCWLKVDVRSEGLKPESAKSSLKPVAP